MGWIATSTCACAMLWVVCGVQSAGVVQKCCPESEALVVANGNATCRRTTRTGNLWWFPSTIPVRPGQVRHARLPVCDVTLMDMLMNTEGDFSMYERNGELLLRVLRNDTHHDPVVIHRNDSFPPSSYCVDWESTRSDHVVIVCPCLHSTCVRSCCPDNDWYNKATGLCEEIPEDVLEKNALLEGWVPKVQEFSSYYRMFRKPSCEKYTIHEGKATPRNGSMYLLLENGKLQSLDGTKEEFPKDKYCGGFNTNMQEMLILCLAVDKEWVGKRIAYGVMFVIGALSLLLTVVVTLILPELRRNIHGKMGLAHNVMLFIGYVTIGVSQLGGSIFSQASCEAMSLIIQFSILAAFFWLNVMCIDISWTFSGLRPILGNVMQRDNTKLLYYSLYVWGGTGIISIATISVEYSAQESSVRPTFGTMMCFFNNRKAELLFFYGPMALLLMANLILFAYTAYKIILVRRETSILCACESSTSANNKQTLVLYLKLFCLMGITWVTEVLSWAIGGPKYYWYLTDSINVLRAVFIFVIFCCKRSVFNMLRNRWSQVVGGEPVGHGSTRSNRIMSTTSTRITTASSVAPSMRKQSMGTGTGVGSAGGAETNRDKTISESSLGDSTL